MEMFKDRAGQATASTKLVELGYQFDGTRYDAGTRLGWLKANVTVALESEDADEFRTYIRGLDLRD